MNNTYAKLRGRIREICGTQNEFCRRFPMKVPTLTNKLSGRTDFTREEMARSAEILEFDISEIPSFFYENS